MGRSRGTGATEDGREGTGATEDGREGTGVTEDGREGTGATEDGREGTGVTEDGREGTGSPARDSSPPRDASEERAKKRDREEDDNASDDDENKKQKVDSEKEDATSEDEVDFGNQEGKTTHYKFVLFGPTGSGKTTLVNWLTAPDKDYIDKQRGGHASAAASSVTTKVSIVESGVFTECGEKYQLSFADTPGFGANDEKRFTEKGGLMAQTLKQLVDESNDHINGILLVLKMERFRQDLKKSLEEYIRMFDELKLSKKSVMIFITHSLQFTDKIQTKFSDQIFDIFNTQTVKENIRHVNFCMPADFRKDFRKLYQQHATKELSSVRNLLLKFKEPQSLRKWMNEKNGVYATIDGAFGKKKSSTIDGAGGKKRGILDMGKSALSSILDMGK